jgi:hypothetical protein
MRSTGMRTFKNIITVMAIVSLTTFTMISCGGKKDQAPAGGADSTMTQTAPDTTGAAAGGAAATTDTTKAK